MPNGADDDREARRLHDVRKNLPHLRAHFRRERHGRIADVEAHLALFSHGEKGLLGQVEVRRADILGVWALEVVDGQRLSAEGEPKRVGPAGAD